MLKGKLVLNGTIELISPAIIGSGDNEKSDIDLVRDSDGKVYIPATSFVGVLRHSIKLGTQYKNKFKNFWGSSQDEDGEDIFQSSIKIDDLLPLDEPSIKIRDGVKIDNKKGIAEDKGKFDYEVIEPGGIFNLKAEINIYENEDNFKKRMLSTIVKLLEEEKIRIGAKTTSGFGKIKLRDYRFYEFDFSKKNDVLRWLKGEFSKPSSLDVEPFEIESKIFQIEAEFAIKNSLIVRSYNFDPDKPDIEHMKSRGKPVLPGTSIKGAIRARAERIVKTIGKSEKIIDELFGNVDEENKTAKKGKISVDETFIDGYPEEVQTRIKIDRFTGGVMEGALLETKPLFSKKEPNSIKITLTIQNVKPHEAGLMLLVLKDLWTGDLPIGGEKAIGRGVLKGKGAKIIYNGETIAEFTNINELSQEQKNKLQGFVDMLKNYGGQE